MYRDMLSARQLVSQHALFSTRALNGIRIAGRVMAFACATGVLFTPLTSAADSNRRMATGQVHVAEFQTPVANALVTDGFSFVRTDLEGQYELALDHAARWILLVNPPGYKPKRKLYQMLPNDGATGESTTIVANFSLEPLASSPDRPFRFVHMSDSHIANEYRGERIRSEFLEPINRMPERPAFVLDSGDLSIRSLEQLEIAHKVITELEVPFLPCIGNHDRPAEGFFRGASFERLFRPVYHAFTYHDNLFIALPWQDMAGDACDWTRKLLAELAEEDLHLIAYMHHLDGLAELQQEFIALFVEHEFLALFMGHYHANQVYELHGIPAYLVTSAVPYNRDLTRPAFNLVTVKPQGELEVEQRMAGQRRHVSLVAPAAGGALYSDVEQNLLVGALDTGVPVRRVKATLYEGSVQGHRLEQLALEQANQYLWRASVNIDDSWPASVYLVIEIEDEAGEVWPRMYTHHPVLAASQRPRPQLDDKEKPTGLRTAEKQAPVEVAWVHSVSGSFGLGSPVVRGNTVYIGVEHVREAGRTSPVLLAVDALTGELRWQYQTTTRSIRVTPAVSDELVIAQADDGKVIAVDRSTGELRWSNQGLVSAGGKAQMFFRSSPALIGASGVLVGGGSLYSRLQLADGGPVWRPKQITGGRSWAPVSPTVVGDVALTVQGSRLTALDLATGESCWEKSFHGVDSQPAVVDDVIYGVVRRRGDDNGAGDYGRWDTQAVALDLKSGDLLWCTPLRHRGLSFVPPKVQDGTMLIVDYDDVVALNTTSGEKLWRSSFAPAITEHDRLMARDLTTASLYADARYGLVVGAPQVTRRYLYLVTRTGRLTAFDLAGRKLAWHYDVGAYVDAAPAVAGNTVYIAGRNGVLYALVAQ